MLLLGSGSLKIGQAGEFDYAGSQAIKAIKEDGIICVLINPNIATVQTDEDMADRIYFLPLEPAFIEEVIIKEQIDSILFSFGGQTALNCALTLDKSGLLSKYKISVLGTSIEAIRNTEDRQLFKEKLAQIGLLTAESKAVYSVDEAVTAADNIGYPVMMRNGFSLGGKGSSIVYNQNECRQLATLTFAATTQILIEKSLSGWKEIEYELVRDFADNCITVCNMENVDPMGIHTGESIVVAPSQTLDDFEYQLLRDIAIKAIRYLDIVGECNIQFALDPYSREYRIIEVNARLSRSSALASKATGYPLAYVAAKIALGHNLPDITNVITKNTSAFFEPALDYIVCKIPRWDLEKFPGVSHTIGTEMKSVGEVMSIGRSFSEALQKAIRMLDLNLDGLETNRYAFDDLKKAISTPTPKRIFAIAQAIYSGMDLIEINQLSHIDLFFLYEIESIVLLEKRIEKTEKLHFFSRQLMLECKRSGFSDKGLGNLLHCTESQVRALRNQFKIHPYLSQIDTVAAEFPAQTNLLYFTYSRRQSDVILDKEKKILILGSGCYRIGSSVEFDWCSLGALKEARELGYKTITLNCNPETVSTDYDVSDYLVFDEITLEIVLELYQFMKPEGIIISMGGQTPNNLALKLHQEDVHILGTHPYSIDNAENRHKFSVLLDAIHIKQPLWIETSAIEHIEEDIAKIGGFPVLIRPSYVLSGSAMQVVYSLHDLKFFIQKVQVFSSEYPIVISKYEENAREIDFDAVADRGSLVHYAVLEHIEQAGVHSGDATLVFPPINLTERITNDIINIGSVLAEHLKITGPFNMQLLLTSEGELKVIECNLRASRSLPFVSKALGVNFSREATRLLLGYKVLSTKKTTVNYFGVKSAQFSFSPLKEADPLSGIEMASTGEVGCFSRHFQGALLAAMIAKGFKLPQKGVFISFENKDDAHFFCSEILLLEKMGLKIHTTPQTEPCLTRNKILCISVDLLTLKAVNPSELINFLKYGNIDLVISIPDKKNTTNIRKDYFLRRLAVDLDVALITDMNLAKAVVHALFDVHENPDLGINVEAWNDLIENN